MNIRPDLRHYSDGHSTSSPQQHTYDAGLYISENLGPSASRKMPIYNRRNNEEVLHSNLQSSRDLSRPNKDYHGKIFYLLYQSYR